MYDSPWVGFCYIFTAVSVLLYIGFTIVVTIGGLKDLVYLFKELKSEVLDETDDGRVIQQEAK